MKRFLLGVTLFALGLVACSEPHFDRPAWVHAAEPALSTEALSAMVARGQPDQAMLWEVVQGADRFKAIADDKRGAPSAGTDASALIGGRVTMAAGMELYCRLRLAMTPQARNSYFTLALAADPTKLEKERRLDLQGAYDGGSAGAAGSLVQRAPAGGRRLAARLGG